MGLTVSAIPIRSNDTIPPFNVLDTMSTNVLRPEDNKTLPLGAISSLRWFPVEPIVPTGGSIGQAWNSVSDAWRTSMQDEKIGTQRVVNALSESFGWEPLSSAAPSLLLDTFKETYLAPPLLTKSETAQSNPILGYAQVLNTFQAFTETFLMST